jgi:hypothetical protein
MSAIVPGAMMSGIRSEGTFDCDTIDMDSVRDVFQLLLAKVGEFNG